MSEAVMRNSVVRPPTQNQPLPLPLAGFVVGFCIVTALYFVISSDFEDGVFWLSQAMRLF